MEGGNPPSHEGEDGEKRRDKRRSSLEKVLTSGCGHGQKKKKVVEGFWLGCWPELQKAGWTLVSLRCSSAGKCDEIRPNRRRLLQVCQDVLQRSRPRGGGKVYISFYLLL